MVNIKRISNFLAKILSLKEKLFKMSQYSFFNQLSEQWWSESGAFALLHSMNSVRIQFIKNLANKYFPKNGLENLKILDVGCGGGIACESLARLGAKVTGIDIGELSILAARTHAASQNLNIEYKCAALQNIKNTYDMLICLEVVEHVDNLEIFVANLIEKINKGGIIVLSTLNRTIFSYLLGILGAEYITGEVPMGTHDWDNFVEPSEIVALMENYGMAAIELKGLNYSILKSQWYLGGGLSMNYLAGFRKGD